MLKRRGYVQQDEETSGIGLTLKMLDLSFQHLGRSELRLHAYPVLRDYVLGSACGRSSPCPAADEVTYVWATGADEVAMRTVYGKAMPAHCSLYFRAPCDAPSGLPASSNARATSPTGPRLRRLGPPGVHARRSTWSCTCAPIVDYAGRDVARVGIFAHGRTRTPAGDRDESRWRELARLISLRLGGCRRLDGHPA